MQEGEGGKPYDLKEHALLFARQVRVLLRMAPRTMSNLEDGKQLIRTSGSVGANYIEANDALSKKDFLLHLRISRREAKESRFFLRLIDTGNLHEAEPLRGKLVQEASELVNILIAMIRRAEEP